ncbi:MAG: flagellar type III secretion system pore protein FliP [Synergistales bacterium]|nr:flagellar type III secretion system pore protein FliP [Synergistales bacterium]
MPTRVVVSFLAAFALMLCLASGVWAQPEAPQIPLPALEMGLSAAESPEDIAVTLQILALLTILTLAPAIVLMMTSFVRILVVLGFVRHALALQQTPPNQVLVTLALFLTLFTMTPVWQAIYDDALQPYLAEEITSVEALQTAVQPVRTFMLEQTREKELSLMMSLAGLPRPQGPDDVPFRALAPAFMLSELKTAFQMGVLIFVPFIVVDMIVASVLMSMGMIMLPPMMISLPFKVLLFVMSDGWNLVVSSLVSSF